MKKDNQAPSRVPEDVLRGRYYLGSLLPLRQQGFSRICEVQPGFAKLLGEEVPKVVSEREGVVLFQRGLEALGLDLLQDPKGYMAYPNNAMSYLKDTFRRHYSEAREQVENGFLDGTGYGLTAVLDALNTSVRKSLATHLPFDANYRDLLYTPVTKEFQEAADAFAKARVRQTLAHEKKRSYEGAALDRLHGQVDAAGTRLRDVMAEDLGWHLQAQKDEQAQTDGQAQEDDAVTPKVSSHPVKSPPVKSDAVFDR